MSDHGDHSVVRGGHAGAATRPWVASYVQHGVVAESDSGSWMRVRSWSTKWGMVPHGVQPISAESFGFVDRAPGTRLGYVEVDFKRIWRKWREFESLRARFVWPADRTWCITADVDPHWARIGAAKPTIDRLIADRRIDAVRTDPADDQPFYR